VAQLAKLAYKEPWQGNHGGCGDLLLVDLVSLHSLAAT